MVSAATSAPHATAAKPARGARTGLRVGGLVPLTTTDYPGELAAVVFCQGCPWHCGYCHNPHLMAPRGEAEIPWGAVLSFLERRRGLLDAVVFSGGEPTLQAAIVDAARAVRAMGFKIGLHTAGPYPRRLARLLPLLDWVGMDVKAPFESYADVTGVAGSGAAARESLRLILASGVDYECRTTVAADLLRAGALERLGAEIANLGVTRYALQACRRAGDGSPHIDSIEISPALCDSLGARFASFHVRGADEEHPPARHDRESRPQPLTAIT